ncbi:uncharacterized protein LOC129281342 [Lytechinus pictus]|uniref:uncharacterized protein LOC129281342 n=1 Tax=Lytechinus pictus TaxID=7653 RepID=UPI0030BA0CDE
MDIPGDYTMTREEALSFLRDVLMIESAVSKLQSDKPIFLDELITAMGHHIPYQTVKGIATHPDNRILPTASDIKRDITSKVGGLCYQLNIFCWMLLRALDFDAFLVSGDYMHYKDQHVVIIIDSLTGNGSKHFFDVGLGYPTLQLIPLDFEQESPVYFDSYMRYRFVRQGTKVLTLQLSVETNPAQAYHVKPEYICDGWISFIFIYVDHPVTISHFNNSMTDIFTVADPENCYLTSLRCLTYPNGRLTCIKDSKLLLKDEEHRVQVTRFRSRDEVLAAFVRYFPQLPVDMVKTAIKDFEFAFERK